MNDELESHCRIVARRLRDGTVVPFLGAGANLCGRPAGADWQGGHYLPSGAELTSYLADSYAYPQGERRDLLRVSQYVQAMTGGNVLYSELRGLFNRAGTAGEIELYGGVHHGFAFPERWCYDKPAAERHWERLIALYRRCLG